VSVGEQNKPKQSLVIVQSGTAIKDWCTPLISPHLLTIKNDGKTYAEKHVSYSMINLILGNPKDVHVIHLTNALREANSTVVQLNTRLLPIQVKASWESETEKSYLFLADNYKLNIESIHSIFLRRISEPYIPPLDNAKQERIALDDSTTTLRVILKSSPAFWVNSWEISYRIHEEKPLQLSNAKKLGIKVPATLTTNDPEQVIKFVESKERVIFKPVCGGAWTQFVTNFHLDPKRLSLALKISPVTFQEYIAGTNIRTYVIDESVYSAEVKSESVDFRQDKTSQLIPVNLPERIREQSLDIARNFGLLWTAIDWRLDPAGEYVFLEANSNPVFLYFERQTGFPVTQELVKLLTKVR
jgi:glutathione synthase/RimK-type ligase-like ATP-grasp enzyme